MARNQIANMGSSPQSSNEATHYGSPATNITAMSPEAFGLAQNDCPSGEALFRVNINQGPARRVTIFNNLPLPVVGSAQLSPTAEEFTPHIAHLGYTFSPAHHLVASSIPDSRAGGESSSHGAIGQVPTSVITDMDVPVILTFHTRVHCGTFSTDEVVTRAFQIVGLGYHDVDPIIGSFRNQFNTIAFIDSRHSHDGILRFIFTDDREAKQAFVLAVSATHNRCRVEQLSPKMLAIAQGRNPDLVSNFEGQLIVTLLCQPPPDMPRLDQVYEQLKAFGDVKAVHTINSHINNALAFRVEYHNAPDADVAFEHLEASSDEDVRFLVGRFEPDGFPRNANFMRQAPAMRSESRPSLTGRSIVPYRIFNRTENEVVRVMRENPGPSRAIARAGHNVVDIGRIEAGLDVRTTIMLRNIPNRVDQATLKALLDMSSFGYFDFMYLRIDFANNCNVGYAFINFIDPLAIIPFARARAGQRWNIFSSDKVAEISYATIQGRDCLIQKFRNSSVMLEHPTFCPKLYYAYPSPFVGQEEKFPEPDNYSKMKRSMDNAEHIGLYRPAQGSQHEASEPAIVHYGIPNASWSPAAPLARINQTRFGLFAPREGQAHREEQRRRRSQYDRGTPGAEIELSSYRLTDAALDGPRRASVRLNEAFNNFHL